MSSTKFDQDFVDDAASVGVACASQAIGVAMCRLQTAANSKAFADIGDVSTDFQKIYTIDGVTIIITHEVTFRKVPSLLMLSALEEVPGNLFAPYFRKVTGISEAEVTLLVNQAYNGVKVNPAADENVGQYL